MYNISQLSPEHKNTINQINELLHSFNDRQHKLQKKIDHYNTDLLLVCDKYSLVTSLSYEYYNNNLIINCIRWVRYFLYGLSIELVNIKTNQLFNKHNMWNQNPFNINVRIYEWAQTTLRINNYMVSEIFYTMTFKDIIYQIFNIILPKSGGIFDIINRNYSLITLDDCVCKMKNEIDG